VAPPAATALDLGDAPADEGDDDVPGRSAAAARGLDLLSDHLPRLSAHEAAERIPCPRAASASSGRKRPALSKVRTRLASAKGERVSDELLIAVFVDYENLALGVRDLKGAAHGHFHIELVLKRLLEKGRVVYKRAYCDWTRYRDALREFHAHGMEMVDIPQSRQGGKNSADIRMVVDAIDLCYSKEHIDVFALLSGDSDFSPLVSKLKENDKRVIGCGVRNSTSELLVANCDEFLFYDDLVKAQSERPARRRGPEKAGGPDVALERLVEIVRSLEQDYDPLWGSIVKQTMRRVHPGFNEAQHGYRSFGELLEAAEKRGMIALEYDPSRGNYKIRLGED
jgi:hypothetical protein